jgi:starvation-inducible outer membrane lipoprotein
MSRTMLMLSCLLLCSACITTPRYQLPRTEPQLQQTVKTAEQAYLALYQDAQAGRLTVPALVQVDRLYEAWRMTQELLIDAIRAGAIGVAPKE